MNHRPRSGRKRKVSDEDIPPHRCPPHGSNFQRWLHTHHLCDRGAESVKIKKPEEHAHGRIQRNISQRSGIGKSV